MYSNLSVGSLTGLRLSLHALFPRFRQLTGGENITSNKDCLLLRNVDTIIGEKQQIKKLSFQSEIILLMSARLVNDQSCGVMRIFEQALSSSVRQHGRNYTKTSQATCLVDTRQKKTWREYNCPVGDVGCKV